MGATFREAAQERWTGLTAPGIGACPDKFDHDQRCSRPRSGQHLPGLPQGHGITSNAGSAQAAPCGSTSADQVVKMSSGRNADTRKLGTSTSWLTLRSTATLQMAYAC